MRLAKLASQKSKTKNAQQKYELQQQQQQQQQNNELLTKSHATGDDKGKGGGFVKRFSGTLSILSSSNNSGSARSSVAGINSSNVPRNSLGNGSCISSSGASTNNTCTLGHKKRRKSKGSKCFSSTVFRCCLPCRGGSGSAAPATSPSQTPVPPNNSLSSNAKAESHQVKRKRSGKSAIELTTDGNESLIAAVKKHSLADTIGTSATTPISLKTLINDEDEEDLQAHISAADIAAAKLASGILPRKAEPETLSDTSISPTTAVLQLAAAGSASASSLLSTTNSLLSTTTAINTTIQVTFANTKTTQSSPVTPPNGNGTLVYQTVSATATAAAALTQPQPPLSPLAALTTSAGLVTATTTSPTPATAAPATTAAPSSTTPSRCCCPPPQTSPLPHIKEEEESEQFLQRQHSANQEDEPTSDKQQQQQQQQSQLDQLSPYTANNPSGSSDSCTSLSATAITTATTSSITGGGCTPQDLTTSTPSPRIKLKFRKHNKSGWSRIILAPSSGETLASSSNNSSSAATVSAAVAQTRYASSSSTALATQPSSSGQLLPAGKMQAEQGSIGDLQKYHSRYLKNRRHTLANVR